MEQSFWNTVDTLLASSTLQIDRPKGSRHPRFLITYPLDYGYLQGTHSPDGDGIDFWQGSLSHSQCVGIICTVDLTKRDSEIKLLLGCTPAECQLILAFHNQSQGMKGLLVERPATPTTETAE